jgi:hypothetical protein
MIHTPCLDLTDEFIEKRNTEFHRGTQSFTEKTQRDTERISVKLRASSVGSLKRVIYD